MKNLLHFSVLFLFFLSIFSACTPEEEHAEDDILLATVHNKNLYVSDMPGMFPDRTGSEDSVMIIENYVRRWVRDAVLMHEAEQNVSQDLNIDKLVRDYRASLVRYHYEEYLVTEMLDSVVTEQELVDFYEKSKEQFQLEAAEMRCFFLKIPTGSPDAERVRQWWEGNEENDLKFLQSWASTNAKVSYLNDSLWYRVSEIAAYLPKGTLNEGNVVAKRDFRQKDGEYDYYFKMLELVKRKEIPPLSYVEGQARKYILHRRQTKLLEDLKEQMFEKEMRDNNVRVFTYE
ncbi:MAG: hypothetical protein ACI85O_001000 [Saprospiraceae bacterium]|jgi:hypothetical protein